METARRYLGPGQATHTLTTYGQVKPYFLVLGFVLSEWLSPGNL